MRLRIRLAKEHSARFFSHLDLLRTLERSLRRAGLPLSYTQGFSPHPRISFAAALATGASSEGEFIDLELDRDIDPAAFAAAANRSCPPGLSVAEARVAPAEGESLQALLNASAYRLTIVLPAEAAGVTTATVAEALEAFLKAEAVAVTKEGKRGPHPVDIRPQVVALWLEAISPAPPAWLPPAVEAGAAVSLRAILDMGNQSNLKPDDLLAGLKAVSELFRSAVLVQAHRLMMYRKNGLTGTLDEPWDLVR